MGVGQHGGVRVLAMSHVTSILPDCKADPFTGRNLGRGDTFNLFVVSLYIQGYSEPRREKFKVCFFAMKSRCADESRLHTDTWVEVRNSAYFYWIVSLRGC